MEGGGGGHPQYPGYPGCTQPGPAGWNNNLGPGQHGVQGSYSLAGPGQPSPGLPPGPGQPGPAPVPSPLYPWMRSQFGKPDPHTELGTATSIIHLI